MAGRPVLLDSSGWIAVLNRRESLHIRARERWIELSRANRTILFTQWVVAETGNGLARTEARGRFVELTREMLRNSRFRMISISSDLLQRALELYAERPDKPWGLVDCASFVVMADEGITDAFTTDRHFEQAGFTCLLPASSD